MSIMTKVARTLDELNDLLIEQIKFIERSSAAYDEGHQDEAKRLAVHIRVIVHDTAQSTSLLTHLNRKGIEFADTSIPFEESNIFPHSSLVQLHVSKSGIRPKPRLDTNEPAAKAEFETWWNGIVFVDRLRNRFSRKDIILSIANKDGGAHVDLAVDEKYKKLRDDSAMGIVQVLPNGEETAASDQVPSAVRQIAHEILKSLNPNYSCTHSKSSEGVAIVEGISFHP